ncbi:MAG: glycosyltransferase family 4 protein [bacterium]
MINIAFTHYWGKPLKDGGGGNKIIFEILKNLDYSNFNPLYISSQFSSKIAAKEIEDLIINNKNSSFLKIPQIILKKLEEKLLKKSYLTKSFNNWNKSLESNINNFKNIQLMHHHHPYSVPNKYLTNLPQILTLHNPGLYTFSHFKYILNNNRYNSFINSNKQKELDALNTVNLITFPSYAAKNFYFNDLYEKKEFNYKVVYNGIDLEKIKNIKENDEIKKRLNGKTMFLNVSNHIESKNVLLIIEMMKLLKQLNKSFVFYQIGKEGPETIKIKKKIKEYGLEKDFYLLSNIPNEEIIGLLKTTDFFIMAGKNVVFDMVILEALACGTCIIASNDGGNKEVIVDGENGFLVDDITPEGFLRKFLLVEKEKVTNNALITASKFSAKIMTRNYEKIYMELIDGKRF